MPFFWIGAIWFMVTVGL
uniref:Uncharacterized protein n=1 Tax=Rhizophora mucronata TaxID=61149 RepID=A0A2P2PYP1_RHIMU